MRPARTSDDFPLPELPTTATKRFRSSLDRSCAVCFSRPKKRSDSASVKGRKPGYGERWSQLFSTGISLLSVRHELKKIAKLIRIETRFTIDRLGFQKAKLQWRLIRRRPDQDRSGRGWPQPSADNGAALLNVISKVLRLHSPMDEDQRLAVAKL